jgi:4a-hydroxytetrahydrobiopterin dehydratase
MERTPLTPEAIAAALRDLDGWELLDGCLHREVALDDFRAAFAFMTRVAFDAEELNHHPNWSNVWNRVTIDLSTHDAGGVTDLDLELARRISAHVARLDA